MASQKATQAATTHSEAKQEGSKDTRAIESGYLARGLAARAEELQTALARLKATPATLFDSETPIRVGAAVQLLDEDDEPRFVVLLGASGGLEVPHAGVTYRVVTPASPLGRALLGRLEGDEVQIQSPRGPRDYEIEEVF